MDLARNFNSKAKTVLTEHFASSVNSSLLSHNIGDGVGMYEFIKPEFRRELEKDAELQERLARAYVETGQYSKAREAIGNVQQYASESDTRNNAREFENRLTELSRLNDELSSLRSSIKNASDRYGFHVSETGVPSTHCSYTSQEEEIPQHVQELIDEYDTMASDFYGLKDQTGKPATVKKSRSKKHVISMSN